MNLLTQPTRHLFFTGKGGVGKTALACAIAIALADSGKRVLLVSTDPASNLDEMLGQKLAAVATPIPGVDRLSALNIDPEAAAEAYRARVLAPYRGAKSDAELTTMREELSGACTTEIAAFDAFATLLADGDPAFDHVIFDTAPTGHTLRLLQLPRAWTTFLESNKRGATCLGPHSGLTMQQDRFAAAVRALGDPRRTTIVLVARPVVSALREAARTSRELRQLDFNNQRLVLNAVFHATDPHDPIAHAFEKRGADALAQMPPELHLLTVDRVPLRPYNMVGLPALRALLREDQEPLGPSPTPAVPELPRLTTIVDEIAAAQHQLVMVMGKGGVGKTTIAAAIAVELASRGIPVHLSTTDPAAHIEQTLAGSLLSLEVSRIDPQAEVRAYTAKVMERKGRGLDAPGRALLEEDLQSPCTEEVAVFHAFSRIVATARQHIVILDTAPTGHTLLLLDATGAYHHEVMRGVVQAGSSRLITPLMRLQDPAYTKVLLVTLAETTPVSEAAQLQADLRRASVEPYAWVINSSLAATGTRDPLLQRRVHGEIEQIERVRTRLAQRVAIVPWAPEEPVGTDRLRALTR